MKKPAIAIILGALGMAPSIQAHGFIDEPPSRMKICGKESQPDQVMLGTAKTMACSTAYKVDQLAAYNYMAVVTHSWGRSQVTPLPKYVCGFAGESWKGAETPWDAAMDWPTTQMSAGMQTITWDITNGPHFDDTKEFKYWITKSSFVFSPTKALAWDDFETEPFCTLNYDDFKPTANPNVIADKPKSKFITKCNMPQRNGHHVVYGEWGRTEPTKERFHGCFDAQFGAVSPIRIPYRPGAAPALSGQAATPAGTDLLGRPRDLGRPGILVRPALPR